jgi:UDP-N-acetylmuramyl-tripeptide synthetase
VEKYSTVDNMILEGGILPGKVKIDSRMVTAGDVFIAVKGVNCDGHDYIEEAAKKNPSLIICEHNHAVSGIKKEITVLEVEDTVDIMGYIARAIYKNPSGHMETYGITGTNGKTTTVFLLNSILEKSGQKCGFISTVYTKVNSRILEKSLMTTPAVFDLYSSLNKMYEDGKDTAIVEISSHALAQRRVWGIKLNTAVFTNITSEHMDYHGTMENYFFEKSKIIDLLKKGGKAVLNADDPMVSTLTAGKEYYNYVTFGIKNAADVTASDIKMSTLGTEFNMFLKGSDVFKVKTSLIGEHNVYNILAAVSAVMDKSISAEILLSALKDVKAPPGRLEPVVLNDPFSVFVDYAHTPDALKNVLSCLKSLAKKNIICVFGCGGDRDRSKRSVMGKIASEYADSLIITSDNPRTEAPLSIIEQIEEGIADGVSYTVIENRESAINKAITSAQKDDVVLIAGKGHEDYQILGKTRVRFDDREVAAAAIKRNKIK